MSEKAAGDDQARRPDEQTVRGWPEIEFMRLIFDPLGAQSPRQWRPTDAAMSHVRAGPTMAMRQQFVRNRKMKRRRHSSQGNKAEKQMPIPKARNARDKAAATNAPATTPTQDATEDMRCLTVLTEPPSTEPV